MGQHAMNRQSRFGISPIKSVMGKILGITNATSDLSPEKFAERKFRLAV
jgi:hypothetical protein